MAGQQDLAEKRHWDAVYRKRYEEIRPGWRPVGYDTLSLEWLLLSVIDRHQPGSVLEIGCGNSVWLPHLAKLRGVRVAGIDYSEEGCALARRRLEVEGVAGEVFQLDLFEADPARVGQFDLVYSLGVVEHFTDLEHVLSHLLKFVRPGGVLLTEVPNMGSIHGFLSWIYQPGLLAKHELVTRRSLIDAYRRLGLVNGYAACLGLFSLNVVAWGHEQRFPWLDRLLLPCMGKMVSLTDGVMRRLNSFRGIPGLAPFLYAVGIKPDDGERECVA